MQFQYLLLLFVLFQNSHTWESDTSKTITVKGTAFMCSFHIQYNEKICFQNSTVSCSPNAKKKRTVKNIPLELNDGTKINIQKLKISRKPKKDRIIRAEIINPPSSSPAPSNCNVIDGPAKGESCVFPFTYTVCAYESAEGGSCMSKIYTECAYDQYDPSHGDTYPWCSTKVDASGNHVIGGGHWGECDPDTCAVKTTLNPPSPTPAPSICNVIDGPAEGEFCVFPFTWRGKTYTECAYEPSQGDTYPWCSTKVDATGNHVSGGGHWGECDPNTCAVSSTSASPSVMTDSPSWFDYCSISSDHTLCKYSGPSTECKANTIKRGLSDKAKRAIVDKHNELRRKVAKGLETRGRPGPQPPASDMLLMVWDDELATIAQRWADQCDFGHDSNRNTKEGYVGQNVYKTSSSAKMSDDALAGSYVDATTSWYEEVSKPGFSKFNVNPFVYSSGIGHYTQIVWGSSRKIGCGSVYANSRSGRLPYSQYVVCNYFTGGNVQGRAMYNLGPACSACPAGYSTCSDGLCTV